MRWELFVRVWFIVYCIEAGVFLLLAPWSPAWERALSALPLSQAFPLLVHPAARGAVSGFGLMHLVWGAHDLDRMLARRRTRNAI